MLFASLSGGIDELGCYHLHGNLAKMIGHSSLFYHLIELFQELQKLLLIFSQNLSCQEFAFDIMKSCLDSTHPK